METDFVPTLNFKTHIPMSMKLINCKQIKLTVNGNLTLTSFSSQNNNLSTILHIEYEIIFVNFKKQKIMLTISWMQMLTGNKKHKNMCDNHTPICE